MDVTALIPVFILLLADLTEAVTFFENHRYGDANHKPLLLKGYSGVKEMLMKERQETLIKFIGASQLNGSLSEQFKPNDVIRPVDVVGVLPSNIFKMQKTKDAAGRDKKQKIADKEVAGDAETGESQIRPTYTNVWSGSKFTPEHITNHKYPPSTPHHKSVGLYEKPYGRVKVHTYRGPTKEYWVLHRKAEQKTYAPWGYYVRQPVGSEEHKFHSPLDLSFNFER